MRTVKKIVELDENGKNSGYSLKHQALAWSVHLFTASGVVWGFLAILAIFNRQWIWAFFWMALAVVIDSLDGLLARKVGVKKVLPQFDGALLDNMVDFFNYAIVPAILLHQAAILPPRMALLAAISVMLASAYQFSIVDAKTEDHYFKGFPSYWNVTAFYMFLFGLNPWINFAVIMLFCVLVFIPLKYVYPTRTTHLRTLTMTLTTVWGVITFVALFQYPTPQPWLVWASVAYLLYYGGLSLYGNVKSLARK